MKREVQSRTAKWIVADMLHKGAVTEQEAHKLVSQLLEYYDPPYACLESKRAPTGDGINLVERDEYYASAAYRKKIICGLCGSYYGPKPIHSNDKYSKYYDHK